MRLRVRLVLYIAIAALLPVVVLGVAAVGIAGARLDARVQDLQARSADSLAVYVETWMSSRLLLLEQQVQSLDPGRLDEAGKIGFLRLVYRQAPEAAVVALIGADGRPVAPPVYMPPELVLEDQDNLAQRDRIDSERIARFEERLAAEPTLLSGDPSAVLGAPYIPAGRAGPVILVRVPSREPGLWVAVELVLDPLTDRLLGQSGPEVDVALLDGEGRIVVGGEVGLVDPSAYRAFLGRTRADGIRYNLEDGQRVLSSSSPVQRAGWTIVVAEPDEVSTAATRDIRDRTTFVALVASALSLVLGVLFSRQLSGPVIDLKDAALAVAEGELGRSVRPTGGDEITELAHAFNFMSQSLARNAKEISAQREEIEAFNRVLQERVEARTKELRQTQDRLVQSARLAAVGELGAGMAHELNNPVAGILGMVQVLLRRRTDTPEQPMLRTIEELAVRCKDIVGRLVGLSQGTLEGPDAPTAEVGPIDLDALLDSAVEVVAGPMRQRGVGLSRGGASGLVVQGDRAELLRAFAQVLLSLRAAARQGGSLQIHCSERGEDVVCDFILDAPVIDVGGDDWMASGLGFWAARQAVARHRGRLVEPDGPPTSGRATWGVELPRA